MTNVYSEISQKLMIYGRVALPTHAPVPAGGMIYELSPFIHGGRLIRAVLADPASRVPHPTYLGDGTLDLGMPDPDVVETVIAASEGFCIDFQEFVLLLDENASLNFSQDSALDTICGTFTAWKLESGLVLLHPISVFTVNGTMDNIPKTASVSTSRFLVTDLQLSGINDSGSMTLSSIPAGLAVGLVGPAQSGKTTWISALCRELAKIDDLLILRFLVDEPDDGFELPNMLTIHKTKYNSVSLFSALVNFIPRKYPDVNKILIIEDSLSSLAVTVVPGYSSASAGKGALHSAKRLLMPVARIPSQLSRDLKEATGKEVDVALIATFNTPTAGDQGGEAADDWINLVSSAFHLTVTFKRPVARVRSRLGQEQTSAIIAKKVSGSDDDMADINTDDRTLLDYVMRPIVLSSEIRNKLNP